MKLNQSSFFGGTPPGGAPTASQITGAVGPDVQTVAPASGATVQINDNAKDTTLVVNPAGDLATLTINLPSEANSRIGQVIMIRARRNIAAVTLGGATTILGTVGSFLMDDAFVFQKTAANTWENMT